MPAKPKTIPHFASEAEELEFWDTHDIEDYDAGPADDIVWDLRRPAPKQRINLRLEPELIEELKAAAQEVGMPYQALTRGLIRRGLQSLREMRKAG
jgi:predicted DNA binding CopG/RHH family protein